MPEVSVDPLKPTTIFSNI